MKTAQGYDIDMERVRKECERAVSPYGVVTYNIPDVCISIRKMIHNMLFIEKNMQNRRRYSDYIDMSVECGFISPVIIYDLAFSINRVYFLEDGCIQIRSSGGLDEPLGILIGDAVANHFKARA